MPPLVVSLLLVLAGFACIFLELLIPSAGVIALISGSLLISGIVVAFTAGTLTGFLVLLFTLVALPIVIVFLIQIWPNTPIGRRLFSKLPSKEEIEPEPTRLESLKSLVGKHGVARSKLLPSGGITIEGKHYDAVSDGLPIEKDQKITVVAIRAGRIFVRPMLRSASEETVSTPLDQSIESLGLESLDDPLEK